MGSCVCLKDGRDIIEHAASHNCPEERFSARGLGDFVARILKRSGIHRLFNLYRDQTAWQRTGSSEASNCGCARRRDALNQWVIRR